ncbi:MAG: potassium channel family protein [Planctomycetota bacterium]|jgi:trk system potassium uptake protein TrkA
MKKYAVIGLGRFGSTLARQLGESGADVIAIDRLEDSVAKVRDHVSVAVCMDGTDEKALREQGLADVDVAVVAMAESFEATQLATVILRRLGVGRLVVKAAMPLHEHIFRRIGADEVVSPEKESAIRLAQRLIVPNIVDYIELAEGHKLVQLIAPKKFHGKTIRELDVRDAYGVNIVAIRKRKEVKAEESGEPVYEEKLVDIPRPTDVIDPTDVLLVIGEDRDLTRLAN